MISRLPIVLLMTLMATGADAKDRRPDKPVPSSTGCEWAGPGFAKVDGSSTCVRVSGSVRAEYGASLGTGRAGSWRPQ